MSRRFSKVPWRKAAAAVLGFLSAAAIGNWIADEYADRTQERELEATLLTTVSRGVSALYGETQQLKFGPATGPENEERERHLLSEWLGTSAEIDAILTVYYPRGSAANDRARDHWNAYQGALYQYGKLACCNEDQRRQSVEEIQRYLSEYGVLESYAGGDEFRDSIGRFTRVDPVDDEKLRELAAGNDDYYKPLGLYLLQVPELLGEDITSAEPRLDG